MSGRITAGPAAAGVAGAAVIGATASVAGRNTSDAGHGGEVAMLRAALGVARASAGVCDTASAAVARLAAQAARIATHLTVWAARATDTSSISGACGSATAGTHVTAAAGVAVRAVAISATLTAGPVATVQACGTAGRGRGAVAVAVAISDAANRSGRGGTTTLAASSPAMSSISGAFARGRCTGTKHLCAPMGAIGIGCITMALDLIAEDSAHTAQAEEAADRRGNNGPQRMSP